MVAKFDTVIMLSQQPFISGIVLAALPNTLVAYIRCRRGIKWLSTELLRNDGIYRLALWS